MTGRYYSAWHGYNQRVKLLN